MKFIKPSGIEIEVADNPETIAYCKSLGWVPEDDKPKRARQKDRAVAK